ncbi:ArgS-related anticodon-binding protein NrtL [Streptomyces sp. NPDC015242]|uniref:ArgS-related anticodon-binding protein NrtL n=1 Tax=Streptomyces sp. NPDC015242 TaxID=3364951 RepID=UPI0036F7CDA2
MTPVELSRTVLHAVRRAVDEGELSVTVPERAVVAPPGPGGCGDYATNIALQLARAAGRPPRDVAEILKARLLDDEQRFADVVVTGPGFLNLSLRGDAATGLVEEILRRGRRYGHTEVAGAGEAGGGERADEAGVRLVCAAEVRAVVVADAVARVLRSQGHAVRVECDGPLAPEWESVLGADATPTDAHPGSDPTSGSDSCSGSDPTSGSDSCSGSDSASEADSTPAPAPGPGRTPYPDRPVTVRPTPAPADPTPLGRDAARWALLHPAPHDRPRITRDHLVQRETNPLFRVRYAHARTRALLRNAADLGFRPEPGPVAFLGTASAPDHRPQPGPAAPLGTAADHGSRAVRDAAPTSLLTLLRDHPRVLAATAAHRGPDRLARHLVAVADATLPLLHSVLPLGEEKPSAAHRARLALAEAAGTVLAGGLSLLGIDAPEHL